MDTNSNGKLTAAEIEAFIEDELGTDVSAYLVKVNEFANDIQTYYSGLSKQKKLEYVLDRTREYLVAADLSKQIQALNRLVTAHDTANTDALAKVGQIVITDLNPGYVSGAFTLGAYSCSAYISPEDYEVEGVKYDVGLWASDDDEGEYDFGITLDKTLLNGKWYELVDTLVHELTHATAYQYAGTDQSGYYDFSLFNFAEVTNMYNKNIINSTEYKWYKDHWEDNDYYPEKIARLMYLIECQRGEYAACQVDADYIDSIAGDILDGKDVMSMAVSGAQEKSTIENHIYNLYDNIDGDITNKYSRSDTIIKTGVVSETDLNSADKNKNIYQDTDGDGKVSKGDLIYEYDSSEEDWIASNAYEREAIPDYKWWTYRGVIA